MIKVAMSLHDQQIPGTLHFKKPNPQIDIENSPFYVCDSLTPWKRGEQPRRGGVSSFGVGGTNAHILLEEAPQVCQPKVDCAVEAQQASNELPAWILPVSGKTEDALVANVANLATHLTNDAADPDHLANTAQTLQLGRDEFTYRAAIVSDSTSDAASVLDAKKSTKLHAPQSVFNATRCRVHVPGSRFSVRSDGQKPVRSFGGFQAKSRQVLGVAAAIVGT